MGPKEGWLSSFLDLEQGIPSHDTFNRVISAIDSDVFERCFVEWVGELIQVTDVREIVNIDGKTISGAREMGKKSPIHMARARAHHNNLVVGQVKVGQKSNEITAIPALPMFIKLGVLKHVGGDANMGNLLQLLIRPMSLSLHFAMHYTA